MTGHLYQFLQLDFAPSPAPQIYIGLCRVAGTCRVYYHVRPPIPISGVAICRQRDRSGLGAFFTNRVPFWKAHSAGTPLPRVLDSPMVLGPRGPAPALGPCFFRHSLFPLTHPQHHGPNGRSSPAAFRQNHQRMNSVLQIHVLWRRPGCGSLVHCKGQRATVGVHLGYPVPITPGQLRSNSKSCFNRARAGLSFSKCIGDGEEGRWQKEREKSGRGGADKVSHLSKGSRDCKSKTKGRLDSKWVTSLNVSKQRPSRLHVRECFPPTYSGKDTE